MILNIKDNIKKAFTLSEIIVATFISVIILSFIFIFISNIISGISSLNKEVKVLSSFYDFTNKINNLRNVYITGGILVDSAEGGDVFLMKDVTGENGVLFGPIILNTRKLDLNNLVYKNKGVGFRRISPTEMIDIESDINVIYNYTFQSDQIFSDLKPQNMNIESYNSGEIYDLNLYLDIDYQSSLAGKFWSDLPKDNLRKFNIDF